MIFQKSDRFNIKNDLVYALISHGDGSSIKLPIKNWNIWSTSVRGIVTWLATEAIQLRRYPWHPDDCQRKPEPQDLDAAIAFLREHLDTDRKIQDAVDEFRRIYDMTQAVFSKHGITTAVLSRSVCDNQIRINQGCAQLGYADLILNMAHAARRLGQGSIRLPTNILTSWTYGEDSRYPNNSLTFSVEHPVSHVLWVNDLFLSRASDPWSMAAESGEWVVLNRDLEGTIEVPLDGIYEHCPDPLWVPRYLKLVRPIGPEANLTDDEMAENFLDLQARTGPPESSYLKPPVFNRMNKPSLRERLKIARKVLKWE
ncbi:hypothetical protein [Pseudomonas aeruginosa]|uniref:hypothetical protein n=1 Tax=Pseudomonas aeruginosa TaxID=287 RepID=UPI000B11BEFF|nr:hypothetical protein [Pseudomonas aeruginosa]